LHSAGEQLMCEIDWTAIWTGALAIVAFGSFWLQLYFSRRQLREARESFEKSLEAQHAVSRNEIANQLYLQMTNRFDSERMRNSRKYLANHFLKTAAPDFAIKEEVMNFFEDLGALLKSDRLDEPLTYNALCYHAVGWWAACEPYVTRQRQKKSDDTIYDKFEAFADRMMVLDAAERHVDRIKLEPDGGYLKIFLDEEARI
jgi:hypothetical protein